MTREIYTPPPPDVVPAPKEAYAVMGQDNIYLMLEDFYYLLGKSNIKHLFPKSKEGLAAASKKSAAFFTHLLGGPPLYHQQYGPPRMRARHMPFIINEKDKDVWLACFHEVLIDADAKYKFPNQHLDTFKAFLAGFALWMVNSR